MRRAISIAVASISLASLGLASLGLASLGLAGCSGFFPGAPSIPMEFQSTPSGAEARTSMGQSCRTPCSINVPAPEDDFTVSFTLNNFSPVTIPVRITRVVGGFMTPPFTSLDPNPVVAQLQPVARPPQSARVRAKKPEKPQAAAQ